MAQVIAASSCWVRCSYCRARRTLSRHPDEYMRIPPCVNHACRRSQKRRGVRQRYYVDRWRAIHECGPKKPRPCMCNAPMTAQGKPFPHRRGSGWCVHNAAITDDDLRHRWESGARF